MCKQWLTFLSVLLIVCFSLPEQSLAQEAAPSVGYPSVHQGYPTTQSLYGASVSSRQATRLRALEGNLNTLASRSGGRILDGSLTMALGATFITVGILLDDPFVRVLLVTTGSVAMGRGVIQLAALPDAQDASIEFAHMPMLSASQVIARISFGEESLARLARRSRTARLLDGSLSMLAGLTYVPAYMFAKERRDSSFRFGDEGIDYVMAAFGGISFVAGLVTVLVKSDAEHRYRAYADLNRRLKAEESTQGALRLQVAPYASRDGTGVAAQMRF